MVILYEWPVMCCIAVKRKMSTNQPTNQGLITKSGIDCSSFDCCSFWHSSLTFTCEWSLLAKLVSCSHMGSPLQHGGLPFTPPLTATEWKVLVVQKLDTYKLSMEACSWVLTGTWLTIAFYGWVKQLSFRAWPHALFVIHLAFDKEEQQGHYTYVTGTHKGLSKGKLGIITLLDVTAISTWETYYFATSCLLSCNLNSFPNSSEGGGGGFLLSE